MFLEPFMLPDKTKQNKKNARPTDPTWQVRLLVKQGFFFVA